jgi:hypothetical protein
LPQWIRDHFPDATFRDPCSQADVTRAEQALGEQLPKMLRELYLAFDGFRMPEGGGWDALLPLFGREGLVGMNDFFRNGAEFPTKLISQCLFFGNDGIGGHWGSSGTCQAKSFAGTQSGARTSRFRRHPPRCVACREAKVRRAQRTEIAMSVSGGTAIWPTRRGTLHLCKPSTKAHPLEGLNGSDLKKKRLV